MKYFTLLVFSTIAFFAQVQAQSESEVITQAIENNYTIERDTQSVFGNYTHDYDTTFATPPDTGIVSIDTNIVDSLYISQYRLKVDVGGFGTLVALTWRDSTDYVNFVNGLVSSAYREVYRLSLKEHQGVRFARSVNNELGEEHISWARTQVNGGLNGNYTLRRSGQAVNVEIKNATGGRMDDKDGTFVTINTKLASVRYPDATGNRIELIFEDNDLNVTLIKLRGQTKWEGFEDGSLIRLIKQ